MATRIQYDQRMAAARGYKYIGGNADWCVGAWSVDSNGEGERYGIVILDNEDESYSLAYASGDEASYADRFDAEGSAAAYTVYHTGGARTIFRLANSSEVLAFMKYRKNCGGMN